jgi:cation:H+ antiporter
VGGLLLCLGSAELLSRGLTRLGIKAGLTEGLVGLLAALGADAPELSSAVTAIVSGARDVGIGVVLGSNLFNLAALLGFSSIVAGGVRIRRDPLVLDAAVGLVITLSAGVLLGGFAPAGVAVLPALVVFVVYVLLLGHFHGLGRRYWPEAFEFATEPANDRSWGPALLLPAGVAGVLGGSIAMVRSALDLAAAWHAPGWLLGAVVLAGLTSLPNLYVAIHFARGDRGSALVSAAMNSNTINLLGGLFAPALVLGFATSADAAVEMAWLLGLTVLTLALAFWRRGLGRLAGSAVVAAYAGFVLSGLVVRG